MDPATAATKIQAHYRGHHSRRRHKLGKAQSFRVGSDGNQVDRVQAAHDAAILQNPHEDYRRDRIETPEERATRHRGGAGLFYHGHADLLETLAAIKIQSFWRGYSLRKRLPAAYKKKLFESLH
eukprot:COSAG06_NODE_34747_length_470_cov_0.555256_1_plen_123_part_10